MKSEHTPKRLQRIVDRGWDYTVRYMLLYLAVSGRLRVLGSCIGALGLVAYTMLGYRP
ncbi:hypothetical protein [Mycolicibacterium vinylchloridicum]|uniref:hypothetical protein n=1 Tax=Mycolicibacterium vinylchloridicum TaxID=2736928 RepID=UPI0002F0BC04|nr:hypothetical protein [Mycolicibacterium vinylchloridicum]